MDLSSYRERFQALVELEQQEEMRHHQREMEQLTGEQRQRRGRCLLDLSARGTESGFSEEVRVRYERPDGSRLGDHEFSTGNLVQVSKQRPLDDDNPTATVWACDRHSITLSFRNDPPNWVKGSGLRLDLYVDDITYQRMLDALFLLPGLTHDQKPLLDVLLGESTARPEPPDSLEFFNQDLNHEQQQAVRRALSSNKLFLVHGPPGTGKTVTLTEIILQAKNRNQNILATAASNVAVDNLTENLLDYQCSVVRVGHPARTSPALRDTTLDAQLENHSTYRESEQYRQEALDLIEEKRSLTPPSPRWRRGMSDGEILARAEEGTSTRGVSNQKLKEMARHIEINDRIDDLFQRSDQLEQQAIDELLDSADVICTTNSTAGSELLSGKRFDLLIIDEATQATEPSCLIPVTKTNKLVMAGDHRQLPPTVLSQEAAREGLEVSLFERLANETGESNLQSLELQYRMHRDIMKFPSREFYDGSLQAHHSVQDHTLNDLPNFNRSEQSGAVPSAFRPRPVISCIDTTELESNERQQQGSTSHSNPLEQEFLVRLWSEARSTGLKPQQVGIITPYRDQARQVRQQLDEPELEVQTVDGFQGREKELIIISFVRSNPEGEIGFLYDPRRLNVSLTRARRKLILLGDVETLSSNKLFSRLFEFVSNQGEMIRPSSTEQN